MDIRLAKETVIRRTEIVSELGEGSFSKVYQATECNSGRVVALKKSRVSLRVNRTHLHHEARVLKLLQGHPAIPAVYGYGRPRHFELLTMELLGQSLDRVVKKIGPLPLQVVVDIADQMLDVLAHVQRHGIVHRDVKPANIVFKRSGPCDPEVHIFQVCLIDFGLAYRPPKMPRPPPIEHENGPPHLIGTLHYGSINAHHQRDLMYRDDIESLAYTLIRILRGMLPWIHLGENRGTLFAHCRQVLAQKERYTGAQLADEIPEVFGALVDYARGLAVDEVPEYDTWRQRLRYCLSGDDLNGSNGDHKFWECLSGNGGEGANEGRQQSPDVLSDSLSESMDADCSPAPVLPPPFKAGDVVLVQLLSAPTVEGYAPQDHEHSHIPDPSLFLDEWKTPARPGLVLEIVWDKHKCLYMFGVVGLRRQSVDGMPDDVTSSVPIAGPGAAADPEHAVSLQPDWPLTDSYCYVYKQMQWFYCNPTQEPVPVVWSADVDSIELLWDRLVNPFRRLYALDAADADERHAARMEDRYTTSYAQVYPLCHEHVAGTGTRTAASSGLEAGVDWGARRAWFDECVRAARRHDLDDKLWWTGAAFPDSHEASASLYSFIGRETWWYPMRQGERSELLTLSTGSVPRGKGEGEGAHGAIPGLDWLTLDQSCICDTCCLLRAGNEPADSRL